MITIVCASNRENGNSEIITSAYADILRDAAVDFELLLLKDLASDFAYKDVFGEKREEAKNVITRYISKADKFVFIIPEYNGSFPGVLKSFIDMIPNENFYGKKAGLVGLSAGHSGGLLAMEQFTAILNYINVNVHFCKPKLSAIEDLIDGERRLVDERAIALLKEHAAFIKDF